MANRAAEKIKRRRERLKENQIPVVISKPQFVLFCALAVLSVSIIIYLSYLAYTSDFSNQLIIPIIAAITVLLLLIIWYLPKFYVRSLPNKTGKDLDREKERLKLEDDTRKTFAQIVGGIVLLGGLILTYNTFRLQQEGQFADRFNKAVTQLGDDKLEIRLAGMYALERIATDSSKDHWTVMEILSAYIREYTKKKSEPLKNDNNKTLNDRVDESERNKKILTDVQAALTIIGRRKIKQDSEAGRINLSEVNLNKAFLSGANFSEAYLSRADLGDAFLSEVNLSKADLSEAYLTGADLSRADLSRADLNRANLSWANLSWANLRGANLSGADLTLVSLVRADLRDADLNLVEILTFEQLGAAIINENTILPSDLESRKAELLEISKKNLEERNRLKENNHK